MESLASIFMFITAYVGSIAGFATRNKNFHLFLGISVCFLLAAISFDRSGGIDFLSYSRLHSLGETVHLEYIYKPIFHLTSSVNMAFFWVHLLTTFFVLVKAVVTRAFLPLVLVFYLSHYFFVFGIGQIRAGLAASIMLYLMLIFQDKRVLIPILGTLTFHSSSLIYAILLIRKMIIKYFVFLCIIALILNMSLVAILKEHLLIVLSEIPGLNRLANYSGYEKYLAPTTIISLDIIFYLITITLYKFGVTSVSKVESDLIVILKASLIVYFLLSSVGIFAERLGSFLAFSSIFLNARLSMKSTKYFLFFYLSYMLILLKNLGVFYEVG